jgi:CDP-6-deoxy-D-xylo-4-hexulose-3-dehydrase
MQVTFAGVVDGQEEFNAVRRVFDSKWHANGFECDALEKELARYTWADYAVVLNSGSSANLLALMALDLPKGSKVLTSGCGFPATLYPILHAGMEPVLVDYELPSHNIDISQVLQKCEEEDVKAIIFAHTMANPVDVERIIQAVSEKGIYVIEDCCEALGSRINNQPVGSFGTLGTFSFYPSHQINGFGGGGAVVTSDKNLAYKIRSMREWGKQVDMDFQGVHITSPENEIDGIPYDSHYTYETMGFNMKYPDANCAYTRVQLERLPGFIERRQSNYEYLKDRMREFKDHFIQMESIAGADLANFGYILTLREDSPLSRDGLLRYLEDCGVGTRLFFAGNITRHKPFRHLFRELTIADYLMKRSMYVGCWHGLNTEHMDYIYETVRDYVKSI